MGKLKRVIAIGIALAVIVGGGLWWRGSGDSDRTPGPGTASADPTSPGATPAVSSGYRLVGRGRFVVEVPKSWGTGDVDCGTAMSDTVAFHQSVTAACLPPDGKFSVVTIAPYALGESREQTSDMRAVSISSKVDDAKIHIRSTNQGVIDRIVDSQRRLPEGWTTVPDLFNGFSEGKPGVDAVPDRAEMTLRLKRFGLKATFVSGGPPFASDPASGSAVRRGETITVTSNL